MEVASVSMTAHGPQTPIVLAKGKASPAPDSAAQARATAAETAGKRQDGMGFGIGTSEASVASRPKAPAVIEGGNDRIRFDVDPESGEVIARIIDAETSEVVRQIPPEEFLSLKERMALTHGVLLDRQV